MRVSRPPPAGKRRGDWPRLADCWICSIFAAPGARRRGKRGFDDERRRHRSGWKARRGFARRGRRGRAHAAPLHPRRGRRRPGPGSAQALRPGRAPDASGSRRRVCSARRPDASDAEEGRHPAHRLRRQRDQRDLQPGCREHADRQPARLPRVRPADARRPVPPARARPGARLAVEQGRDRVGDPAAQRRALARRQAVHRRRRHLHLPHTRQPGEPRPLRGHAVPDERHQEAERHPRAGSAQLTQRRPVIDLRLLQRGDRRAERCEGLHQANRDWLLQARVVHARKAERVDREPRLLGFAEALSGRSRAAVDR